MCALCTASVLNTFSKIYEQIIKEQIAFDTKKIVSPEIPTYKKSYKIVNRMKQNDCTR